MQKPNEFTFDSIGTRFWLNRLDGKPFTADITSKITHYATNFDETYSRFKETSLISKLAADGFITTPPAELLAMLRYGKQVYFDSDGVFNITVGAALHAMGYGAKKHAGAVLKDPWQAITWDNQAVHSPKGLMLDLGGFGKGWMIDHIADILRKNNVPTFIVNGGGDLYVQSDRPIDFALEDPLRPGYALQGVSLSNGAIAGSNTIKRAWNANGTVKHHIIDPTTQDSSNSGVIASYVIADTALAADTVATIVIVRPALKQSLEQRYNAKVLLITN